MPRERTIWAKLLGSLSDETGEGVRWIISDLEYSSAIMTAAPLAETDEAERVFPRLVDQYLEAARDVRAGRVDPQRPTLRLVGRLVEKATPDADITFETPEDEVTFEGAPEALELIESPAESPAALGTLRGRIETLSQRGGLRFTLYDLLTDRAVRRVLVVNGHGGNIDALRLVSRIARRDHGSLVASLMWAQLGSDEITSRVTSPVYGHACEIETSVAMELAAPRLADKEDGKAIVDVVYARALEFAQRFAEQKVPDQPGASDDRD